MSKLHITPVPVSLRMSRVEPYVEFSAEGFAVRLQFVEGRLLPKESPADTDPAAPGPMAVRLTTASCVTQVAAYLKHPDDATEKALWDEYTSYQALMQTDPVKAATAAIQNGLNVLQTLVAKNHMPDPDVHIQHQTLVFMPTKVELFTREGVRAVKLSCGEASVTLVPDVSDDDENYAIKGVDITGNQKGMEGRNLKATFSALGDYIGNYVNDKSDSGNALMMVASGWEDMKTEEGGKHARMILPHLMSGEAKLKAAEVQIDPEQANRLVQAYKRGEMSADTLLTALTDEPSDGQARTLH